MNTDGIVVKGFALKLCEKPSNDILYISFSDKQTKQNKQRVSLDNICV